MIYIMVRTCTELCFKIHDDDDESIKITLSSSSDMT